MQEMIKINDIVIHQPDEGLQYNFETTYSSDSTRVQSGQAHFTPLFTVEQLGYTATDIPVKEAKVIIEQIIKGNAFKLHYFSVFYGKWRTAKFRVGKGQFAIGSLKTGEERLTSLSFNMTGEEPL
jgi:hypothetical protein